MLKLFQKSADSIVPASENSTVHPAGDGAAARYLATEVIVVKAGT
jgi:hypothetical protein